MNQRFADLDSNTETKQKQHSCSCHLAELSGAFLLLTNLEISKLAACILKHSFINTIKIMIDKNQVQSRYVDEWNCNIIIVSNLSGTGRFPWEI